MRRGISAADEVAFARHLLTTARSPATVRSYLNVLRIYDAWCVDHDTTPTEASRTDIQLYIAEELGRGIHKSTMAMRLAVFRSYYSYLDDDDHRVHGLRVKPETLEPRLPFQESDIQALIDACRNDRDRAMITLTWRLGLRVSEVVGIRDRDIYPKESLLLVSGKGSKKRWLPLDAHLHALLQPFMGKGPLWWTRDGNPLGAKRAQRNMEEIARRAGIWAHYHRLRTTFANESLESGVPLEDLRILMGHKEISTTAQYAGYAISRRAIGSLRQVQMKKARPQLVAS